MKQSLTSKNKLYILILLLLLITSLGALIFIRLKPSGDQLTAEISQNGTCIKTIDLAQVKEAYEFTVEGTGGTYNVIRVEPGRIAVTQASCPDQVCVRTGWTDKSFKPITCLPNQVIISIKTGSSDPGDSDPGKLDGMTH